MCTFVDPPNITTTEGQAVSIMVFPHYGIVACKFPFVAYDLVFQVCSGLPIPDCLSPLLIC